MEKLLRPGSNNKGGSDTLNPKQKIILFRISISFHCHFVYSHHGLEGIAFVMFHCLHLGYGK